MDETTGYPTGAPLPTAALRDALIDWYLRNGRSLAFRETADPWAILVAEVMSQQTRIDRVEGHWRRFLALYPTPSALAAAPLRDVVRAWAGLGYNRRAVNLQAAARAIVERHAGRVPGTAAELETLPGIGPYTARATAATAFAVPVAAVDVNVRRVVGRLAGDPLALAEIQRRSDALVDPARPDLWTHAVMDLAATVCRRRAPACTDCPLAEWCRSRGTAGEEPRARGAGTPFPTTRRWLRGRLLAEIAAAEGDGWLDVDGGRGVHEPSAVREAVGGLARDGLVEIDAAGRARIR